MGDEYQDINLLEILGVIVKKWWIIALFMLITGGSSYYITQNMIQPIYQAQSTLFIGKEANTITNFSLSDLQMDNKLVGDYRELLKTRLITREVIQQLGLSISESQLVSQLSVEVVSDSRLINITYKDANPEVAALVANKLSEKLIETVSQIIGIQNIRVIDSAIVPSLPIGPNIRMNIIVASFFGAFIASVIIFIIHIIDNTIKREDQLEKLIGFPVLAVIPNFKEGR